VEDGDGGDRQMQQCPSNSSAVKDATMPLVTSTRGRSSPAPPR
jgi:hypothetical protein